MMGNDLRQRNNGGTNHHNDAPLSTSQTARLADKEPPRQPGKRRKYGPRTCRICFDVVQPTFKDTSDQEGEAAAQPHPTRRGVFSFEPYMQYISDDARLGKLVSPCKCKGTQKYVHEGCLQLWRHAASRSAGNYWKCPTCKFEYDLGRLRWARWIRSRTIRYSLTTLVSLLAVFLLGIISKPVLLFTTDPWGCLARLIMGWDNQRLPPDLMDDEPETWWGHFLNGVASLGALGCLHAIIPMTRMRVLGFRTVFFGDVPRVGAGRNRYAHVNWVLVGFGVSAFVRMVLRFVNRICERSLERVSVMVVDIGGSDDDGDGGEDMDDGDAGDASDGVSTNP